MAVVEWNDTTGEPVPGTKDAQGCTKLQSLKSRIGAAGAHVNASVPRWCRSRPVQLIRIQRGDAPEVSARISRVMHEDQQGSSSTVMEPAMEVLLESEEQMARNKEKGRGKRQRANSHAAPPTTAQVHLKTGRAFDRAGGGMAEDDW